MKKLILMTLAFITAAALSACSSSVTPTEPVVASNNSSTAQHDRNFEQRKSMILNHINERLAKIHEIENCVDAANDDRALHACKPHRHHHDRSE